MSEFIHVDPRLHALFKGPDKERIRHIRKDQYVPYARGKEVIADIEQIIEDEPSCRPLCALIVGEAGRGKTTLLNVIQSRHPPYACLHSRITKRPVVRINLAEKTDAASFSRDILRALHVPFGERDHSDSLRANVCTSLEIAGTRVLMIDELHNLFLANRKVINENMAFLRHLNNTPKVSLICAGTEVAETCVLADRQLDTRFDRHYLGSWAETNELRQFLGNLEWRLPLHKPSNLAGKVMLPHLLRVSSGEMRLLIRIIQEAGKLAVINGLERITMDVCSEMAARFARRESLKAAKAAGLETLPKVRGEKRQTRAHVLEVASDG